MAGLTQRVVSSICPDLIYDRPADAMTKPERSFRQQAPAGFDKDLRTCYDVGVAGVFTPVMTDAADRGYEQHARRHDRGENLGVMAGAAWHADRPAAGKGNARSFDCTLKCRIHHGGGAGAKKLPLDAAAGLRGGLGRPWSPWILQGGDAA